ncbi:hypothetical protein [Paenibacillus daejeonensis]|uniref:hypothetical protein n=1 Tax=Paenibacillus daejeonensis TaxID=135193 RepID=UPI00037ABF7C|nr:hypothetical protein [Paenibacillus daejeonensis]
MKKRLYIPALLLLMISVLGCSTNREPIFQVAPTELFGGEAAKFKGFMEHAGAVNVQYRGQKESIQLMAEVWVNGELQEVHSQLGGFLTQDAGNSLRSWEGEVIISINKTTNDEDHTQYHTKSVFYNESGHVGYEYTFDAMEAHAAFASILMHQEQSISPEDGEVAIWGLQANSQSVLHTVDLSPEQLEKTNWAVIYKLIATDSDL